MTSHTWFVPDSVRHLEAGVAPFEKGQRTGTGGNGLSDVALDRFRSEAVEIGLGGGHELPVPGGDFHSILEQTHLVAEAA